MPCWLGGEWRKDLLAQGFLLHPLQALVVLDFKLTIDNRTAVGVQLGRRGEAVSSTLPPLLPVLLH